MKPLFIIVLLAIATYFLGQTPYETAMNAAMQNWQTAKTEEQFMAVANEFDMIALEESRNWEPIYYALLVRTSQSFHLPKDKALAQIEMVEKDFSKLTELTNNDETKVLHALYLTAKVAQAPMTYGPTLTEKIIDIYNAALKVNPKNPRALFHLAEYQINASYYFGKDSKEFCPQMELSLLLYNSEEKDGYAPHWEKHEHRKLMKKGVNKTFAYNLFSL